MDIHRCRFVQYPPSTINALAFSHTSAANKSTARVPSLRLAIGRANGDIEIWNPLNGWLQETILKGGKDRSVDGLVWTQDPDEEDGDGGITKGRLRLFSVGYSTTVTEWDLQRGSPLRESSGNHGEIWCLAAQPALNTLEDKAAPVGQWPGQHLVVGCTDGALVLYSTEDDSLTLKKVLARPSTKKAKIISIVFQDRNTVVAGCTDSIIRVFDVKSGSMLRAMSLGSGPSGGPKETFVWAVKIIPGGNIVSGDSNGELRIWDGKTYALLQRIKSHRQDILSIAVSADGSSIFSGGMDRRTTVYKQIGQPGRKRFAEVSHRRYHSHDVKTMATFEGRGLSVVVSGGPDAIPIVIPSKEFGLENQRALSHLPHDTIVRSAPKKRLVMSWWDREVHIWRINKTTKPLETAESESEAEDRTQRRKLVSRILLKGEANITSATISTDGSLLAVSTITEVKLFRLKSRASEDGDNLKVSKVDTSHTLSGTGSKLLQFSPDGRWLLVVRPDNRLVVARITGSGKVVECLPTLSKLERLDRDVEKGNIAGGLGAYERNIGRVAFSADSRIVVVSDHAGYIDSWVLEGNEDLAQMVSIQASASSNASDSGDEDAEDEKPFTLFGQHWARNRSAHLIPKLPSQPLILSFRPSNNQSHTINSNSVHATRSNPLPVSHHVPSGEDRLLVVTAGSIGAYSKVLEFNVLKGCLTPWSKANPVSRFPEEYKGLRDQAMGNVWDITGDKERVWLYGTNWLWMFDLSRNLPVYESPLTNGHSSEVESNLGANQRPTKRRRLRLDDGDMDLRKGTSGAGGKIPDHELTSGISRKMQRYTTDEAQEVKQIRNGGSSMAIDEDDDEDDDEAMEAEFRITGTEVYRKDGDEETGPAHWWHTYKYRPIMGIVPIGEGDGESGPEVAIMERPVWEADLPPRYYGDQEWEKPGVDF